MTGPRLQPAANDEEARVLEIDDGWDQLSDEALEAAIIELREVATSSKLRYGYQRKAHTLADTIDAEFAELPAADHHADE